MLDRFSIEKEGNFSLNCINIPPLFCKSWGQLHKAILNWHIEFVSRTWQRFDSCGKFEVIATIHNYDFLVRTWKNVFWLFCEIFHELERGKRWNEKWPIRISKKANWVFRDIREPLIRWEIKWNCSMYLCNVIVGRLTSCQPVIFILTKCRKHDQPNLLE